MQHNKLVPKRSRQTFWNGLSCLVVYIFDLKQ